MKKLFVLILLILIAAAFYTTFSSREQASVSPVIVWQTDANPQREEQIMLFREWLVKNHHILKDKDGKTVLYSETAAAALNKAYSNTAAPLKAGDPHYVAPGSPMPDGNVLLQTASNQSTLIQAVSGMAGDVFDTGEVLGFQQLGVGLDITADADKNGYGLKNTYPGMAGILTGMDGKQYAYPCNGASACVWINLSTLEKHGFKRPPLEWTPEEFEAMGKEYVKKANEGLSRQQNFFFQTLDSGWGVNILMCIIRSQGFDIYNETLTKCVANDERVRKVFGLFHKWTFADKLAPTAADVASMSASADSGYGGADFSAFSSGKYAMIVMGRYCLIRFREIQKQKGITMEFGVSQMPMYEFKNHPITVRAAMPYRGSAHPELAKKFLQFLAGEEYNRYIVEQADGLPPNIKAVKDADKLLTKYPNENDVHVREIEWAETIALPVHSSPYVKTGSVNWLQNGINQFFNDRLNLEDAVALVENRYNMEIEISKGANPVMKKAWDAAWADQQKIDELKKAGKKIPARLIKNPFYLKYYREKGMLETPAAEGSK